MKGIYPLPMEGGCPKGGGWLKAKESEANLRRCAPPPSSGRRETIIFPVVEKEQNQSCHPIV